MNLRERFKRMANDLAEESLALFECIQTKRPDFLQANEHLVEVETLATHMRDLIEAKDFD